MKPYGIRRADTVHFKCCPGHDNRERKYIVRKLWKGEPGKGGAAFSDNRDRARKKHARQEGKREIVRQVSENL